MSSETTLAEREVFTRKVSALVQVAFIFSLLCICADQAAGQSRQAAEVRGTVTDQSGAVVPGVTVTITNIATETRQQITTDTDGVYDAPSVPMGEISIAFKKDGFSQFDRTGIVLHLGTITVDATLHVGTSTQSIEVKAAAPLVQTENPEESMTLTTQAVTDLPNVGRNWYNYLGLLPGVSGGGSGQNANGQGASVNGQGGFQSNWQIDGGHAMLTSNQNPDQISPPLDDIAEINFATANFGAEYGNGFSVFNVTTKSGTNRWHGSAYEYVENDKLEARNHFAQGNAPLRWNEYGGTFGGPIRRDKAFFFFSYQANPSISHATGYATFPTMAMRNGDFSDPGLQTIYDPNSLTQVNGNWVRQPLTGNLMPPGSIDPVANAIQQYFPKPNLPGLSNNYYFLVRGESRLQWYNGKIDYNLTARNRLSGSLMIIPGRYDNAQAICSIDCTEYIPRWSQGQVTDVWTINPQLVSELRLSIVHLHGGVSKPTLGKGYPEKLGLKNPASDVFPSVSVEGSLNASIGFAGGWQIAIDAESAVVPAETLTWVKGKHILKFGGEYDRWYNNQGWPLTDEGNFDFNGLFSRNPTPPPGTSGGGEGYADFLFGVPATWSVSYVPETGARLRSVQAFAQDEYKIRHNLTLSAGVRYVMQTGWSEIHNRLVDFDPALSNPATDTPGALWFGGRGGRTALQDTVADVFAPRVGIAWAPRPGWSIRAGYGIYNMPWAGNFYCNNSMGVGWGTSGFLTSTDSIHPIFTMAQGPPAAIYPTDAMRTADLLNGQGVSYYPQHTPVGYSEEYRFDVQHQLNGGVLIDAAYVGNGGVHLPFPRDMNQVPQNLLGQGDAQSRRPYPQYSGINAFLAGDTSNYSAFQLTVRKDFSKGLVFAANYTWSKAMDTMTVNNFFGVPTVWQNAYDRAADYGPSNADIRHMFNGSFLYELPVGRGKSFLNRGGTVNAVLGGWQLSSTFQVHSGIPFTPVMDGANLSGSLAGTWRPNRIGSGTEANPTINQWFDPTAFATPASYTYGNSGRNFLYGPGWKDMDWSLAKNFPLKMLGEQGNLLIKVEAFDLFNVANFGMPNANIGNSGVGTIASANTSRVIQLGARLNF